MPSPCILTVLLCDDLNLEEIEDGCGESVGLEGCSGDGEDSDVSETTGMIFFFIAISFTASFKLR